MKNLSRPFFSLCICFLPFLAFAQQNSAREIGLKINSLDNLDLAFLYKKQVGDQTYRRFDLGVTNFTLANIGDGGAGNLFLAFSIAREKRRPVNDKLRFVTGTGWIVNVSALGSGDFNATTIDTGIGLLFGAHYTLSDKFYIGAEITPTITLGGTFGDNGFQNLNLRGQFNSQSVQLSIVHRF
ncbi:MAG: hypothetical protein D6714_02355 [Bacteroidetes bacterium]|nr:MAG: hypothetical protein D6714_02355 [Bacteroidota bacterium]